MATCILVRHGRSTANTAGVLAGWAPDVDLDDTGREQAAALAERLRGLPVAAVVASPLPRCQQTAAVLADALGVAVATDDALGECHYGGWTGRTLTELATDPLWRVVQDRPHEAVFPPSDEHRAESLPEMYARVTDGVRAIDARVEAAHGPGAVWVAVSHGDPIKAVVADVMGGGVDVFQRVHVDPASATVVRWSEGRPMLLRCNDTGRTFAGLVPDPAPPGISAEASAAEAAGSVARPGDGVVGGGAG